MSVTMAAFIGWLIGLVTAFFAIGIVQILRDEPERIGALKLRAAFRFIAVTLAVFFGISLMTGIRIVSGGPMWLDLIGCALLGALASRVPISNSGL